MPQVTVTFLLLKCKCEIVYKGRTKPQMNPNIDPADWIRSER